MKPVITLIVVCLNSANSKSRSALAFGLIALTLCFHVIIVFAADGGLDHTFGSGGKVITQLSQEPSSGIYAIKVQADGKLVAVGAISNNVAADFAIARYNTDGSLDPSFGPGGIVTTDFFWVNRTLLSEQQFKATARSSRLVMLFRMMPPLPHCSERSITGRR